MPDEAGQATIRQAWTELWKLAPRFGSSAQETAFLRGYCRQFANQRRLALLLGIAATVAYLPWDHVYARDPEFDQVLRAVLLNRTLTALLIVPFLALAMRARFAQDERFATAVVTACVFVDFLFYCRGFLLVPYPYDYMYFFMGMCINVVFGFAMLQMRARPVLLQLGSCVLAAAVTFAWNWQLKADVLADHEARIYQWAALSFLSTLAMIGYIVANQFERTRRASFAQTEQLAGSNASLTSRRDDVDRLNQALRMAVERAERESAARTRVLAAASHDLRQPLHALSIYSAVLAADPVPQTLREVGAHIDQIARTLGALLHGAARPVAAVERPLRAGAPAGGAGRVAGIDLSSNTMRAAAAKGLRAAPRAGAAGLAWRHHGRLADCPQPAGQRHQVHGHRLGDHAARGAGGSVRCCRSRTPASGFRTKPSRASTRSSSRSATRAATAARASGWGWPSCTGWSSCPMAPSPCGRRRARAAASR